MVCRGQSQKGLATGDEDMIRFRLAVTYGGLLGRLVRGLGVATWNHIIIVEFVDGQPLTTYESNMLHGVHQHPFRADPDLGWEHQWYEAAVPLTALEVARFSRVCIGECGKWYAFSYLPLLAWRVIKRLLSRPSQALLVPAETCISFVNEPCAAVGRPVSVMGASGLPDDVMSSPHWKKCRGQVVETKKPPCLAAERLGRTLTSNAAWLRASLHIA